MYTEGAGEGKVGVKIIGPGGIDLDYISRAIDPTTQEFTYTPKVQTIYSNFSLVFSILDIFSLGCPENDYTSQTQKLRSSTTKS